MAENTYLIHLRHTGVCVCALYSKQCCLVGDHLLLLRNFGTVFEYVCCYNCCHGWRSFAVKGVWTFCDIYERIVITIAIISWLFTVKGFWALCDITVGKVMILKDAFHIYMLPCGINARNKWLFTHAWPAMNIPTSIQHSWTDVHTLTLPRYVMILIL